MTPHYGNHDEQFEYALMQLRINGKFLDHWPLPYAIYGDGIFTPYRAEWQVRLEGREPQYVEDTPHGYDPIVQGSVEQRLGITIGCLMKMARERYILKPGENHRQQLELFHNYATETLARAQGKS